ALRGGRVSATLVILSVDLGARDVVITRCGDPPVFVHTSSGELRRLSEEAPTLGFYRHARPAVEVLPLEPGLMACAFTDGLLHAGSRTGRHFDVAVAIEEIWTEKPVAQTLADGLLERAIALDDGRPTDDTSIVVVQVLPGEGTGPRFMNIEMPVPEF
ncbi:MAG: SpoIIE family protein phosphatase, partial [Anaerolineae bacterium]